MNHLRDRRVTFAFGTASLLLAACSGQGSPGAALGTANSGNPSVPAAAATGSTAAPAAATPTPKPTATPMPQPTLLSFSPSPITLTGVKSTTVFAVTDANAEYPGGPGSYLGFYRATSEDTSIATVAPGPIEGEFKVTSVAGGSTSIDVSSTDGGFGQLPVTVNDSGTIIDLKGGPR